MKIFLFLAEGFEEIEAITPIDIFRRAGMEVTTVSVTGNKLVAGAHGIIVQADSLFEDTDFNGDFILFLPGGMPGTANLAKHAGLTELLKRQSDRNQTIAAICAAPSIPGKLGLLKGKEAICYPGYEKYLSGATISSAELVRSGSFYTAKAAGVALKFALKIVTDFEGQEKADEIARAIFL